MFFYVMENVIIFYAENKISVLRFRHRNRISHKKLYLDHQRNNFLDKY